MASERVSLYGLADPILQSGDLGLIEDWRPRAEGIGVPTLLIRGGNAARGAIVNNDVAAEAQRLNPKIETVCFAQAGHNIRREAFAPYVAAVTAFLARY